jgi:hypothetical protein
MLQKTAGWTYDQCTHWLTLKTKSILNAVLHAEMKKKNRILKPCKALRGTAATSGIVVTIGSTSMKT